ncbi:hypothetical protein PGT21_003995 [Puccinia graminis f. sp. tritici]|uniref:Ubiquitin-like domain-containing protein n=1 Tax=Puccinia graminis f. sp. tritici TaxID=56615 RepID=A0A5B0LJP4_PUCGR|nr:hypothetical protein PGT21_003995 [Puccinia graminis f. sp. tritici]
MTTTTTNRSSTRTSFSSSQTIIEPERQQELQLQLNNSNSSSSTTNSQVEHSRIQVQQAHRPTERGEAERRNGEEDADEEHERRLRLIEVNRTRTRLIEEELEEEPPPLAGLPGSAPPTAVLTNHCQPPLPIKEPLPETIIPLEILLSPINQKKAFHFDHLLSIAELINHLLNNWPADWSQPGSTIPHHTHQFRMVYMGRFLDDQETLNSLGKNRPIIIHLVIKPDEGAVEEEAEVDEDKPSLCGCFARFRERPSRSATDHPDQQTRPSSGACSIV